MSGLDRRPLLLAAGVCLAVASSPVQAGDHPWFHHHGYYSRTTTVSNGLPVGGVIGITPGMTAPTQLAIPTVAPAQLAIPTVAAAQLVMPTVAAAQLVMPTVAPAQLAMPTVAPAQLALPSLMALPTAAAAPAMSLPAAAPGSSASLMPATTAAQQQAFAAPAAHAALASSSFPALAQAAHRAKGLDGGRFIVFLRSFIRGAAGPGGATAIAVLRPILQNLVRTELGLEPNGSELGNEIERLLGELNGGGDTASPNAGGGQCFTIRVCIEGGNARVSGGGVVAAPVDNGPAGPTPGLALPAARTPSLQAPALAQPQGGAANDQAPPAPAVPVAPADLTPGLAPPRTAAPADRHDEVMAALNEISMSLKKLAEQK